MAVAFRSKATSPGAGSGTTLTFTKPGDWVENDIILFEVYHEDAVASDLFWAAPAGFTYITEARNGPVCVAMWWKRATGSEPASYTFTPDNSTWRSGSLMAYSGAETTGTPANTLGTDTAGSTDKVDLSGTTSADGAMLVALVCSFSDTRCAPTAGTTDCTNERADFGAQAVYDGVQASAGATGTKTYDFVSADSHAGILIELLPETGGGTTHQGAAALTASATLAAVGTAAHTGQAALTGAATLAASGRVAVAGAAALTGAATLAAAGTVAGGAVEGAAALDATASLAATGSVAVAGQGALAASATLAATGHVAVAGVAALTASGTLAAAGTRGALGAAALTASGNLAAAGRVAVAGVAALTAAATLAPTGRVAVRGVAALTATATLTGTAFEPVLITSARPGGGGSASARVGGGQAGSARAGGGGVARAR